MQLRLRPRERMGVILLLSTGAIVVAIGAVRAWYGWLALDATFDQTWWSGPLWDCAIVELNVGIVSRTLKA